MSTPHPPPRPQRTQRRITRLQIRPQSPNLHKPILANPHIPRGHSPAYKPPTARRDAAAPLQSRPGNPRPRRHVCKASRLAADVGYASETRRGL
jgi:hypothetical protein